MYGQQKGVSKWYLVMLIQGISHTLMGNINKTEMVDRDSGYRIFDVCDPQLNMKI